MTFKTPKEIRNLIKVDDSRDNLLTVFAKKTLKQRYCLPDESFQDVFARASYAFCGEDLKLAQRLYDYSSKLWLSYATPLIANGGTARGLPISCFLNYVGDSIKDLTGNFVENGFLATAGGGIGSFWGDVRSIGHSTSKGVETPGVMPFLHCIDSQMLAYHQGVTRRGACAAYMDLSHPEIFDFISMRTTTGGDINRKNQNMHHGVGITDEFMSKVENDEDWNLFDPSSGKVTEVVKARDLWIKILTKRMEKGEPYLFFKDTANKALPKSMKDKNLKIHHTNLCTEIMLPTSKERTAVCCLSSLNVSRFDEWGADSAKFIQDVVTMLDNALDCFITDAPPQMSKAVYSVKQERSIGIGVLGFHSFLQQREVSIGSENSGFLNEMLFSMIKRKATEASKMLAIERGECPDTEGTGMRHSHLLAVAPNASSSIICGTSPSIEPWAANGYAAKTESGTNEIKNNVLEKVLEEYGKNDKKTWSSIITKRGSVQHLEFLTDAQREIFLTALEIDQLDLIELAAERQKYICQAQSVNLFLHSNVTAKRLHKIHFEAWKQGLKSLYYVRVESSKQVENINEKIKREVRVECTEEVCTMCEG